MPEKKTQSMLRSKDVAHILDCSPDDVIQLARKGKLKATKQGRFWRFREKDVMAYVKKLAKGERRTESRPGAATWPG